MKTFQVMNMSGDSSVLNDWGFDTRSSYGQPGSHVNPERGRVFKIEYNEEDSSFTFLNIHGDVLAQGVAEQYHADKRGNWTITFYGKTRVYSTMEKRIVDRQFSFHVKECE